MRNIIALRIVSALNWSRPTTKRQLNQPAGDLMEQTSPGQEDTKDQEKISVTRSSRERSMVPVSCLTNAPMHGVKRMTGSLFFVASFQTQQLFCIYRMNPAHHSTSTS